MLPNGVGYVDLKAFSDSSERELERSVAALLSRGAKSLIVDLRSNPGGLLEQGTAVADLFLGKGQRIVSLRGRTTEANREYTDSTSQRWPNLPLTILVDDRSASAAEIVAGALQDQDRALIVGEPTYGKGSAQRVFRIGDGAVKLTTALWYTPNGRSINRARLEDADLDADGDATPTADSTKRPEFKTDAGRTVLGGGGIVPDIVVPDRVVSKHEKALQEALGANAPKFRDVTVDYAISLKTSGGVSSPDFEVTSAMRDELYRRLQGRGIVVERAVYDSAQTLVDRALGGQITRFVFGTKAEYARTLREDADLAKARELLRGVTTPSELVVRRR